MKIPNYRVRLYLPIERAVDAEERLTEAGFNWQPTMGCWVTYNQNPQVDTLPVEEPGTRQVFLDNGGEPLAMPRRMTEVLHREWSDRIGQVVRVIGSRLLSDKATFKAITFTK
jgi:hypothetical protein